MWSEAKAPVYQYQGRPFIPEPLLRIIYAEAGNQPLEGQVKVGQVVLNRANYKLESVLEVVSARGQFSGYRTRHYLAVRIPPQVYTAAYLALYGPREPRAYYFLNEKIANPYWVRKLRKQKLYTIADHTFYEKESNSRVPL